MYNEVNISTFVQVGYLILSVRIPAVGIADESHPQSVLVSESAFNLSNLPGIYARFTMEVDVIGMRVEYIVARCEQSYRDKCT